MIHNGANKIILVIGALQENKIEGSGKMTSGYFGLSCQVIPL